MHPDFTTRNVAKWVATSIISFQTTKLTANTIEDHTRFDKDDMIVEIGSGLVGWGVGMKLKPVTDKLVDKTTDFLVAKYEARKAKKNTKQN